MQPRLSENHRDHRGQGIGGVHAQVAAPVADRIFDVAACGPAAAVAKVRQSILGHKEQHMGELLRADLKAETR